MLWCWMEITVSSVFQQIIQDVQLHTLAACCVSLFFKLFVTHFYMQTFLEKYNYETKIGHELQILISASIMTHAVVIKGRWFVFVNGPKPKCGHSS